MRSHFLCMFECATIGKIGRDPGRPETMVADRRIDANGDRPATDHASRIGLRHRLVG